MKPDDFIKLIGPAARSSAKQSKIPASFTIAEAALESGWGESLLAKKAFNLFGVKADSSWRGETLTLRTREFFKGQWVMVPALWRKYSDWQGSMDDHAAFLHNNGRYKAAFALCSDVRAFTEAIAKSGYATDPNYAAKIMAVIKSHNLTELDK